MPSPVGHALGGLLVSLVLAPTRQPHESYDRHQGPAGHRSSGFRNRSWAALPAAMACLPDIDFVWGRHNMETHSVGFAVLIGVAVWLPARSTRLAVVCALAVLTHVLFDWLGSDDAAPIGVMALWPLSTNFYFADAWLFDAISRHYWRDDFISQNVIAVVKELVLLGIPACALAWWNRRHE